MDITVYLPDEIGARAKEAGLNLSGLLRAAVVEELERSDTVAQTLSEPQVYEVDLVDDEGRLYTGRITGAQLAEDDRREVFLTEDERLLFYDGRKLAYWEVDDPEDLEDQLSPGAWAEVCHALGITPTVDL